MKHWHSLKAGEVLSALNVKEGGLSSEDAQKLLLEVGPNELKEEKRKSPALLFLHQFKNILIIILLIATGLSLILGEVYDALVIVSIVVVTAFLGFSQEYRAERVLDALKRMTAPTTFVMRDGKEVQIQVQEVVPGDIILLSTGDRVVADARLIESVNIKTDESSLTGESIPVEKYTNPVLEETPVSDRKNMVYAGTAVVYGRGRAVATATGMNTELGKIAELVQITHSEVTPLESRMSNVGKWLGGISVVVCVMVAFLGISRGYPILLMFLWGVSLAVAAVPEALPAVVTGALSVGMRRMAKVNSIVRRLPAVETLGSTSVICVDKTGTMTKGEMTVQEVYVNGRTVKVSGVGYEPRGEFYFKNKKLELEKEGELHTILKAATLCNDSRLEKVEEKWIVNGDPTEGALLTVAAKVGRQKVEVEQKEPRVAEIPFSSERKRMTTVHKTAKGRAAYMKGAPEVVLGYCTKIYSNGKVRGLSEKDRKELMKLNEIMAGKALRNLGIAFRYFPKKRTSFSEKDETDFVFLGMIGMIDPPREEVKDAIKLCKKAGIKVVMITGDHKSTAVAVAKECGLMSGKGANKVLTWEELDKISDEDFTKIVEDIAVYARVSPEHKVKIVKAFKARGEVCAMTGDGVNDAPALKMANIGVAMGITGTEVTKEASDMVLTDDNFASIVKAVKEGREIWGNIKKYLTYLLQCNIMEILVLTSIMMLSPTPQAALALTTIQILWINLTTDGLPAIALGVDPGDPDLMERKPRDPKESVFTKDVKIYLAVVPILTTALLLVAYFFTAFGGSITAARTQLFTAIILIELGIALSARSLKHSVFKVGVFKNKFLWLAIGSSLLLQLIVMFTPQLHGVFDVTYPGASDWLVAIVFTAIIFSGIESGKYIASKMRRT